MTAREFFVAVVNANVSDEITTKANEMIAALDAKNAKRKTTPSKKKMDAADRVISVSDFLHDHIGQQFTRDAIAEAIGATPSQVTAACKVLLAEGVITREEIKIDKARRVVYSED